MARHKEWSVQLEAEFAKPFPASLIGWKPQSVNDKKDSGVAVPYVDPRHYYSRLDDLLGPGGWQAEPEIVNATTIKMKVTILGVTRYGIGEKAANDQNTLAAAEAQAFKRALAHGFDFGRYLYTHMSPVYAGMQPSGKSAKWSKQGRAKLVQAAIEQTGDYQEWLDGKGEEKRRDPMGPDVPDEAPSPNPTDGQFDREPLTWPPEGTEAPRKAQAVGSPEDGPRDFSLKVTKRIAGIVGGKEGDRTTLGAIADAGDEGISYLDWYVGDGNKWAQEGGKEAAAQVLTAIKGDTSDGDDRAPDPASAPAPAQPTPPAEGYHEGINSMVALCEAVGAALKRNVEPGKVWSALHKNPTRRRCGKTVTTG
jgi:hypothetical protein